jgi:CubicO group peptidase (beta-lactamase class C family)
MTKLAVLLLSLLGGQVTMGQQRLSARQIRLIDSIATQDVPANAPGIATAIIQDGNVIYEQYAGYADLADSVKINKLTRFNIASNGKQFTALAILTLIDAQKLKLSDDIRLFLPTLFPNIKDTITVRSLLNHTSGIRDCYDLWSLQGYTWWKKSFSNADVLKLIEKQEDLNFKPDSRYLYSNTNYILLALIIEKVSGKRFVAYTKAMFQKLHMPNTSFADDYRNIPGQIARAYFNFGTWTTYNWIWNVCGDGNIFSTLEDQVQWEKIIQGKSPTGIQREIIERSQQSIHGSRFTQYGYGLEFGQYKNLEYSFHEGATGAWKATVTRFPDRKISIITLTNTGKSLPSVQTRQVADVLFGLKKDEAYLVTKPAGPGKFVSDDEIVGMYLTDNDFAFQFEKRDNKIFLKRAGRNDVELEREAANIYHQRFDPLFKQEFTTKADGTLQVTAYYTSHAPYTLIKQSADFSGFKFERLNGKFVNTETGAVMNISHKAGNTFNIQFNQNDFISTGLMITPQKILVDNYTLTFDLKDTDISRLYLNGDRIRGVTFNR